MSTVMVPNRPMFSLCAGETCASNSSSTARPRPRSSSAASPRYSVVQALIALVAMVRDHACSVWAAKVVAAHGALVGVEHIPAQRMHALALVQLPGDLAAVVLPGQIACGVDRAT